MDKLETSLSASHTAEELTTTQRIHVSGTRGDLNLELDTQKCALFSAVKTGNLALVDEYFRAGIPVDIVDHTNNNCDTVLTLACRLGKKSIVELALSLNAKNDPHPNFGQTALQTAVSSGHTQCARLILDTAAPSCSDVIIVNHEDENKEAPIHIASRCGNVDIIEILLIHGADINLLDGQDRTCLHCASQAGHWECCKILLERGADYLINQWDQNGYTCLHLAVMSNHATCVRLLLESGADTRVTSHSGMTPHQIAISKRMHTLARLVLEYTPSGEHLGINIQGDNAKTYYNERQEHFYKETNDHEAHIPKKDLPRPYSSTSDTNSCEARKYIRSTMKTNYDDRYINTQFETNQQIYEADLNVGHNFNIQQRSARDRTRLEHLGSTTKHFNRYRTSLFTGNPSIRAVGYASDGNDTKGSNDCSSDGGLSLPANFGTQQRNEQGGFDQSFERGNASGVYRRRRSSRSYEENNRTRSRKQSSSQGPLGYRVKAFHFQGHLWHIHYASSGHPYYLRVHDNHSEWDDPRKNSNKMPKKNDSVENKHDAKLEVLKNVESREILREKSRSIRLNHKYEKEEDLKFNRDHVYLPTQTHSEESELPRLGYDRELVSHGHIHAYHSSSNNELSNSDTYISRPISNGPSNAAIDQIRSDLSLATKTDSRVWQPNTKSEISKQIRATSAFLQNKEHAVADSFHQSSRNEVAHDATHNEAFSATPKTTNKKSCKHSDSLSPVITGTKTGDSNSKITITCEKKSDQYIYDSSNTGHVKLHISKEKLEKDDTMAKHATIPKAGVSHPTIVHNMEQDELSWDEMSALNKNKATVNCDTSSGQNMYHNNNTGQTESSISKGNLEKDLVKDDIILKYVTMSKVGVPHSAIVHKMKQDGLSHNEINVFNNKLKLEVKMSIDNSSLPKRSTSDSGAVQEEIASPIKAMKSDCVLAKYAIMANMGVPHLAIVHKMKMENIPFEKIVVFEKALKLKSEDEFKNSNDPPPLLGKHTNILPPPLKESVTAEDLKKDSELSKYITMVNVGVPQLCVLQKLKQDGIPRKKVDMFKEVFGLSECDPPSQLRKNINIPPPPSKKRFTAEVLKKDSELSKYITMVNVGVPQLCVLQKLKQEAIPEKKIKMFKEVFGLVECEDKNDANDNNVITRLPPKPPQKRRRTSVTMQKIHWRELSTEKLQGSLWETCNSDGSELGQDEIKQIESLFSAAPSKLLKVKAKPSTKSNKVKSQTNLIEMKRANNIAISLAQFRSFENYDDLCEAVVMQSKEKLCAEKLHNMQKLLPTKEELNVINSINQIDGLGRAELFFVSVAKISRFAAKLDAFTFSIQFSEQDQQISQLLDSLEQACLDIIGSEALGSVLRRILAVGNLMNESVGKSPAAGITLDSILKTSNKKGLDGKTTVLDHVVGTLMKQEEHDSKTLNFWDDMQSVRGATRIDLRDCKTNYNQLRSSLKKTNGTLNVESKLVKRGAGGKKLKTFVEKCTSFSALASSRLEALSKRLSEVEDAVNSLCNFFGEDPCTCQATSIFAVLTSLAQQVKSSKEIWARKEKARLKT